MRSEPAGTLAPRVVVVHRRTELDDLIDRHATRGQVAFFLRERGRDLAEVQRRHDALMQARRRVSAAVPVDWRHGEVERADLDRFRFDAGDIVVALGQDGLVANVAKYLDGQPVLGVDADPGRGVGVLVRHLAGQVAAALADLAAGRAVVQRRTMVSALLDDGQRLTALNEIYLGDAGHQSARYDLALPDGRLESQSSSGVIVGTGTGATGWLASLRHDRGHQGDPPTPEQHRLAWFVREAWPSPTSGTRCTAGHLMADEQLEVIVRSDRLVVFGDGLERDHLNATWGQQVTLRRAEQVLHLVVPSA
ncbi:MAG: NAD(+)/NADH kinase [Kineosporiaceae bacterium]|nr:NAD(+)/NADH kinase [Kineosporiaceae bacterium]